MKVTKEKAARHRSAVVKSASKLFRRDGFARVGVAEVTAEAGLTHGGFYRHFESKEALFAEACEQAFQEVSSLVGNALKQDNGKELVKQYYLSDAHVREGGMCPVATLAAEVARQGPEIQEAFARGMRAYLGLSGHAIGSAAWNKDTSQMAMLIGALLMASAVRKVDKPLSDAIVAAAQTGK